jgi:hypothetical protein
MEKDLMDCEQYREDRFHDIFCEIIGLATASEEELNQILADQRVNNEKHKQREARAHAIFEERYGRKVN